MSLMKFVITLTSPTKGIPTASHARSEALASRIVKNSKDLKKLTKNIKLSIRKGIKLGLNYQYIDTSQYNDYVIKTAIDELEYLGYEVKRLFTSIRVKIL